MVRTNKSHYPPQRRRLLGSTPARAGNQLPEPRCETFPRRAKEKQGLSQDVRDLPLLYGVHEFFEGVSTVASLTLPRYFLPARVKDEGRHAPRATAKELWSFINGDAKVGQGNIVCSPSRESRASDKRYRLSVDRRF